MAGRKKKQGKKNIVRFPGGLRPNIGIIVFLFVAIYVAYHVYSYFTAVHVSRYEVGQGTIEVNTSYTGLILRKETVVNAAQGGKLDYYLKDNTKAAVGTLVCSVDENGNVSERLNRAADTDAVLEDDNLRGIQSTIREYIEGYADGSYYTTYDFKSDLGGQLMEAINLGALKEISNYTKYAKENQTFHLYHANLPGIAVYYTDGFEDVTPQSITETMFDYSAYEKFSQKTTGVVEAGQPLYKLITDENWQIVVPIEKAVKDTLADGEVVAIRFREDRAKAWAKYEFLSQNGKDYLILNLTHSMIRYAYERYVDINILLDQQTGLKIPNSAIATKTFELVPNEYFTQGGGTSSRTGLMVEHKQENGTYTKAEFVPVTVYYKNEEAQVSYISQDGIRRGDRVVMAGSQNRHEISKRAKLQGVYNINRGYAVFRQIEELYSNDNYTIVKAGTEYGIMLYDYIALDGSSVTEGQILVQ